MNDSFNNAVGPQVRGKQDGPGKLIPVLAIVTLIAALSAATQFFAHSFQYSPQLGANVAHIYPPWQIIPWAMKWYGTYHDAVMSAAGIGVAIGGGGLLLLAVARMIAANSSKANRFLHGSARWANKKDIEGAGLLDRGSGRGVGGDGVYIGAWVDKSGKQHYLRHSGPEHVLCYAPTRSGKGVGLVIPTLLSWPHSAVVTDLKGELWAINCGMAAETRQEQGAAVRAGVRER